MTAILDELCNGVLALFGFVALLLMLVGTLAGLREAGRRGE